MECLSDLIDGKIKCISNIEGDTDKTKYSDNGKLELYSMFLSGFPLSHNFMEQCFQKSAVFKHATVFDICIQKLGVFNSLSKIVLVMTN